MNKHKMTIIAAFGLFIAGPVSASNPAVLPIQHKLASDQTRTPVQLTVSPNRLKPIAKRPQLADLVIRSASIQLAKQCKANAPVLYVTARVQNIGHAASVAKYHVAMIQARATSNLSWGNGHGLPAIAPGKFTSMTFPIYYLQSNPASMQGRHTFALRLNPGKWIHEANYNNNGFRPIMVNIPARFCGLLPDITSHKGPRIGGKVVPWGGSVTVGRRNAKRVGKNGECVFDMYYSISNDGKVATHPAFVDRMMEDGKPVALNSNLHLKAGETSTLRTEPSFLSGSHVLSVSLDAGHAVTESNEGNNLFRVMVNVDRTCHNAMVYPHRVNKLKVK